MCFFPKQNLNEKSKAFQYGITQFDCGVCPECLQKKSRIWALRAGMEAKYSKAFMCTLTYDTYKYDEHGNIIGENDPDRDLRVNKRDCQLFIKRLRKHFENQPIKYIIAGEYGHRTGRAHYHALIFGVSLDDCVFYKKSKRGNVIYKSKTLEKIWQGVRVATKGGICTVDCLNPSVACARYCTKYASKDAGVDDCFMLFSRGIGMRGLLEKFNGKSYWLDGKEYPVPKQVWQAYLRKKYNLDESYTRYINFPDPITKKYKRSELKSAVSLYFVSQKKREQFSAIRDYDDEYKNYINYWKRKGELNEKYKLKIEERIKQLDNSKYWKYKQEALKAYAKRKNMYNVPLLRSTRFLRFEKSPEKFLDRKFMQRWRKFAVSPCHNTANDTIKPKKLLEPVKVYHNAYTSGAFLMPCEWKNGEKSPF